MSTIALILEASTADASVAVLRDATIVAHTTVASRDPHTGARTEGLAAAVQQVIATAGISISDLTAVICGAGPGSFTSLRSAAAIAKGIAFTANIPLYAISTPALMAAHAQLPTGIYLTVLDAGRNEYYVTPVSITDTHITHIGPTTIVSRDHLDRTARDAHATLIGPRTSANSVTHDIHPTATAIQYLDLAAILKTPVDLDLWEPAYGRLAEAQVKWEAIHGRPLPA